MKTIKKIKNGFLIDDYEYVYAFEEVVRILAEYFLTHGEQFIFTDNDENVCDSCIEKLTVIVGSKPWR